MAMKKMKNINPASFQQKSFYGKAKERTENGETILQSYNTDVCKIDRDGNFHKLWNGYSKTTLAHVVAFCVEHGIEYGGKKWWVSLPYHGEKTEQFIVHRTNGYFSWKSQVVFDDEDDAQAFADSFNKGFYGYAFVEAI